MNLLFICRFRLCKNCVRGKDGELLELNFQCGESGAHVNLSIRFEILKSIRTMISKLRAVCALDLKRVIYEVFSHVIRGDLRQEDALSLLSDVTVRNKFFL